MSDFPDRYVRLAKLGEGTYGAVYQCRDTVSGKIVALKRIRLDSGDEGLPATALREMSILLELQHPNVVHLMDIVCTETKLCLIFEYVDQDLKMWMTSSLKTATTNVMKSIMFQILAGLLHCHENRILHRDMKPQNILISRDGVVKLADFGLARAFALPIKAYTREVVTQWYRPPEILLGCTIYDPAVDMWSVGCIMAELFQEGTPLFPGDSEIDQLYKIFQLLGTPNATVWAGCAGLENYQACFPSWRPKDLTSEFPNIDQHGIALLEGLLAYNPSNRLSAAKALESVWFDDVRQ